jgi:succinate dehydrogenase/fumarate reductase flavoprotein subunit
MMNPADREITTDVLVVGGGLAGCWAALRACESGARTLLVDKGYVSRAGCSPLSGGVMTAPLSTDDLDVWAGEICERGGYMNNQEWLDQFLADQVGLVEEIDKLGPVIIKDDKGQMRRLSSRGMMSVRCLQFNPKETMTLLRARLEAHGCEILDRVHIVDLLTADDGRVAGAVGLQTRTGETILIRAGACVIAGGPFNVKGRNLVDNVGADGGALAWRAGAELSDMEFSFGGTFSMMLKKYKFPAYNVALGHGAQLINAAGERFMKRYDPERMERSELPQVIAAFLNELLCGRGPVYIDLRHADDHLVDDLRAVRGATWADELTTGRIKDYRDKPVLIEPQWTVWSHRCGIRIDLDCAGSVAGLFAAGSVAKIEAVGTHASAGVPTAFCGVAGSRAGRAAAAFARGIGRDARLDEQAGAVVARLRAVRTRNAHDTPNAVFSAIRDLLGTPLDCMVLSAERLAQIRLQTAALRARCEAMGAPDPHELVKAEEARNFLQAFDVSMAAAEARTESRESFYRTDYPQTDNANWFCWHIAQRDGEGMKFSRVPIPLETYRRKPADMPVSHMSPIALNLEEALHGARVA